MTPWVRDGLVAGAVAGAVSGAPSTLHAVITRRGALDATRAAGRLLAPKASGLRLLAAAAAAHAALSAAWGVVLAALLPDGREVETGALAGAAIAALDLGTVGRRVPAIRALPQWPQVADHVAFGVVVALVVRHRRSGRLSGGRRGGTG